MHQLAIALPEGDFIDTFLLSRKIAHALIRQSNATSGEAIFTHKLFDLKNSPPGLSLQGTEELTEEDRALLRKILPDLPSINFESSSEERERFQKQWAKHRSAPSWHLKLPMQSDEAAARMQASAIQGRHFDELDARIRSGAIRAFDRHHLPAYTAGLNIFIDRDDAQRYLEEHRLASPKSAPTSRKYLRLDESVQRKVIASLEIGDLKQALEISGMDDIAHLKRAVQYWKRRAAQAQTPPSKPELNTPFVQFAKESKRRSKPVRSPSR